MYRLKMVTIPDIRRWFCEEVSGRLKSFSGHAESDAFSSEAYENPSFLPLQTDGYSWGVFVLYYADYMPVCRILALSNGQISLLLLRAALFLHKNELADLPRCILLSVTKAFSTQVRNEI